jgi:hypothetical protein
LALLPFEQWGCSSPRNIALKMTPFPKKPPLSAGNRLFFGLMHILPVLKLLTAYYKKAYPGMSGYFFSDSDSTMT